MKKLLLLVLLTMTTIAPAQENKQSAYIFLKKKSEENKPEIRFNKYEDIISGSAAFLIGNIGYFTTDSSTLKLAYSGVQTVGIIAVGHGIYDYYYPHFESSLLSLLSKKQMTRGELADGYVSLLGEMERAKRLSILWSSSLLTFQYALNAFAGDNIPTDLKDIYLFLGGVNALVAIYSYYNISDYEQFYHKQTTPNLGVFLVPENGSMRSGISISKKW